ncbi:MAG: hypothetical protein HY689_09955 [Chloroflexi bacterium]|nr:hypothetical protein [Chloroflexota bacterium]
MLVSVSLFRLHSATSGSSPTGSVLLSSSPVVGYEEMFSADQLAAEQSYRTVYVPALRRLPGLERYLIGRVVTPEGQPTRYSHLAVLYWRDRDAWVGATAPGVSERLGVPPIAEWVESLETYTADLTAISPMAPPQPQTVLEVVLCNLQPVATPEEADRYYREVYAPYDRQRPGLRRYLVGPTIGLRNAPPAFSRLALLEYEHWSALHAAPAPATAPPPWILPLEAWCCDIQRFVAEVEEVPRE